MTFNGSTREEELERRLERLDQCGLVLIDALQRLRTLSPEAQAIVDEAFAAVAEVAA